MGDEMDEEDMQNQELQHYLEIGAITMEGLDENGEFIFAIQEKAKEVAPQLVVKQDTGELVGCHAGETAAMAQVRALYASEADAEKMKEKNKPIF